MGSIFNLWRHLALWTYTILCGNCWVPYIIFLSFIHTPTRSLRSVPKSPPVLPNPKDSRPSGLKEEPSSHMRLLCETVCLTTSGTVRRYRLFDKNLTTLFSVCSWKHLPFLYLCSISALTGRSAFHGCLGCIRGFWHRPTICAWDVEALSVFLRFRGILMAEGEGVVLFLVSWEYFALETCWSQCSSL